MEKKTETTIMGYIGIMGYILDLYRDNGKENGNYYNIPDQGLGPVRLWGFGFSCTLVHSLHCSSMVLLYNRRALCRDGCSAD